MKSFQRVCFWHWFQKPRVSEALQTAREDTAQEEDCIAAEQEQAQYFAGRL